MDGLLDLVERVERISLASSPLQLFLRTRMISTYFNH